MVVDDFEIKKIIATDYKSNCYIMWNKNTAHAVIIDPNEVEQIVDIIEKNHLYVDYIFATHEHYDHVAALHDVKVYTNGKIIVSNSCRKELPNVQKRLERTYQLHMFFTEGEKKKEIPIYHIVDADESFSEDTIIMWEGKQIFLKLTPGHSRGSISLVFDGKIVFSGDSILPEKPIVTKMLGGNWEEYYEITIKWYKTLSGKILVLPGHGDAFQLSEKLPMYETYHKSR